MKWFVIIDMQNDFCTGSLANKSAEEIIPKIKEMVKLYRNDGYKIIYTQDTHNDNYLTTMEGHYLKFPHCIFDTQGWKIVDSLQPENDDLVLLKTTFGYKDWNKIIQSGDEVVMVGTCTDICVISNALAIKTIDNVKVSIIANCCAGVNETLHNNALSVMKSCQCEII